MLDSRILICNIEDILDILCIPLNIDGYKYIVDTVFINYNKKDCNICDIYKCVALKNHSSYSKVERCIRYICDKYKENISNYFNFYGKLSNKVFISLITREVSRSN